MTKINSKMIIGILFFLVFIPVIVSATCDSSHQTYVYKSAVFYVRNAERIRVTVTNSMGDRYPRCYTTWIYLNGRYVNLDGLPYSPDNWQQAWAPGPDCFGSGYRTTSYSKTAEYDLTRFTDGVPYTGRVEVRVSSYCYESRRVDPCYCWDANVEVIKSKSYTPQYCKVTITVKDKASNYPIPYARVCWSDGCVYTNSNGIASFNVPLGTHTVTISTNGYQSKTITINCQRCGNSIRRTVYLTKTQICTPGEIRNRRCLCPTQVVYEKCKPDGSGWQQIVENCPPNSFCENGYCVFRPSCSVKINDIILEKVNYDDPQNFCLGDTIRVCTDVSLEQYSNDASVTLKMYVDGSYSEFVAFTLNSGSKRICFDKTLNTFDLGEGVHVVKIVASIPCDPDGDLATKEFLVKDCRPRCNLEIVDSKISKNEVKIGNSFDVWVKAKMDYSNAHDAYAYVTVSVVQANDVSQTKEFYFNYPGDTDEHYFTFDTNGWQPGTYYVYVSARGGYECTIQKTYIGSVEVKSYPLPNPKPQTCKVTLTVRDSQTQEPIPYARVCWSDGCVYTNSNGIASFNVPLGTHTVTISTNGYQSKTITINCQRCGNSIRRTVYLTKTQICTPGEIRNRRCLCPTQVVYEKCKPDGSGWQQIVENCPPNSFCENGVCKLKLPPIANAGPDVTVMEGSSVVFLDGSGSYDPDGFIVSYVWKEGSTVLSRSPNFGKEFSVGTHYITLTVTDNDGKKGMDTVVIKVEPKDKFYSDSDESKGPDAYVSRSSAISSGPTIKNELKTGAIYEVGTDIKSIDLPQTRKSFWYIFGFALIILVFFLFTLLRKKSNEEEFKNEATSNDCCNSYKRFKFSFFNRRNGEEV